MHADDERVLKTLRAMQEKSMHIDVIKPMLEACGATHVVYCHGSGERGKDFIYISKGFFGDSKLSVCQVKNEKLTGKSTSLTQSANVVLNQLLQCKNTGVLNPATQDKKEIPNEVVLITTCHLPDAPLADGNHLLNQIRSQCTIIGPEGLVDLLRDRLPELYADLAYPGGGIGKSVLRYVLVHHEAPAFELSRNRTISEFFVNLGLANPSKLMSDLGSGRLKCSTKQRYDSIPSADFMPIDSKARLLSKIIQSNNIFVLKESTHKISGSMNAVIQAIKIDEILEKLAGYIAVRKKQTLSAIAQSISILASAEMLIQEIFDRFNKSNKLAKPVSAEKAVERYNFSFKALDPEVLLEIPDSICITGDAGAGKTCMARVLAQKSIQKDLECVYFPCARLRDRNASLRTELLNFLISINAISTADSFAGLLKKCHIIILDGCDEAATYNTKLGGEIEELQYMNVVSAKIRASDVNGLYAIISPDLEKKIKIQYNKSADEITYSLLKMVSSNDFARLINDILTIRTTLSCSRCCETVQRQRILALSLPAEGRI